MRTPCPPALVRRRRWCAATVAVAAALAWPALAAAADATVAVNDPAGDVPSTPSSSNPQYVAPDVLSASLTYLTMASESPAADMVQGQMQIDATPTAGVQTKLFDRRAIVWRIDADGDPATGAKKAPAIGADVVVTAFGTSSTGIVNEAYVRRWVPSGSSGDFEYPGTKITLYTSDATGFSWTLSPVALGIVRGRAIRVWFEAGRSDGNTTVDRAPDDGLGVSLVPPFPAPTGASLEATAVTTNQTTLAGTVNGLGAPLEWFVEYGSSGAPSSATAIAGVPAGGPPAVGVTLGGLTPATTYWYQLVVRNQWGESRTSPRSFVTAALPAPSSAVASGGPSPSVAAASSVTPTTATLVGAVLPGGTLNTWWFEWGRTANLGQRTRGASLVSAAAPAVVRARVGGLEPGTRYYYRVVASIDGVPAMSTLRQVTTRPVPRLILSGRVRAVCASGSCHVGARSRLVVRVRDARNRVIRGPRAVRGMAATARCVAGCRGPARKVALAPTRTDVVVRLDRVVRTWTLRRGSVVELRITRKGGTGTMYRVTGLGKGVKARVCRLGMTGRSSCPLPATRRAK